ASAPLSSGGRGVLSQGDISGGENLLRRSLELRPAGAERVSLLISLGGVLREEGEFAEADRALGEANDLAAEMADVELLARVETEQLLTALQIDPDAVADRMAADGARMEAAMA